MKWTENKPTLKRYFVQAAVGAVVFALVVALDLVTKRLTEDIDKIWVIEGVFSIVSVRNTGGAWSMFGDNPVMMNVIKGFTFVFIAAVAAALFYPDKRKNMFFVVTLGLLGSGALGNLVDRMSLGYVRDFLSFDLINFPVFNVADMALVTGVFMLVAYIIWVFVKSEIKERKQKNDKAGGEEK